MGGQATLVPATSPTSTRSTGLAPPCSNASAGSTFSWAMAVFSGRSPVGPCRSEGLEQGDGGQRHRQLAFDPLAGPAAAGFKRRARPVHHLGRGAPRAHEALLGPYAVSKAALEAIARTYAAETENTSSIKVMLANPGPLRTRMRALAMPGEDPATLRAPEEFAEKAIPLCAPEWRESGKLYDFPSDRVLDFAAPI